MNTKRKAQVVEVTGVCTLQDAAGVEHPYWRRDGRSVTPGFYVVHWPPGATVGRFNEDTFFEGPFLQRSSAEAALPRIMALAARRGTRYARRRSPEDQMTVVPGRLPLRRPT
jgi:hypothetical protein